MQIIRNRKIYDVVHHRLGRRRRHGGQGPHRSGRRRASCSRPGPMWDPVQRLVHVHVELRHPAPRRGDPRRGSSASSTRALGGWTLEGEPYTQRPGQQLRLVPLAHARRPHQPLGPHLAALRPRRLPAQEPRRPRRRLADHLRRHQAVLRRGRQADRHLRHQPGPDIRTSPTASSCRRRSRAATSC